MARVYVASDGVAVALTGDPAGLAVALRRIEARGRSLQRLLGLGGAEDPPELFRTHPATEARVARLERLASGA